MEVDYRLVVTMVVVVVNVMIHQMNLVHLIFLQVLDYLILDPNWVFSDYEQSIRWVSKSDKNLFKNLYLLSMMWSSSYRYRCIFIIRFNTKSNERNNFTGIHSSDCYLRAWIFWYSMFRHILGSNNFKLYKASKRVVVCVFMSVCVSEHFQFSLKVFREREREKKQQKRKIDDWIFFLRLIEWLRTRLFLFFLVTWVLPYR